jgi:hypothetical protein
MAARKNKPAKGRPKKAAPKPKLEFAVKKNERSELR